MNDKWGKIISVWFAFSCLYIAFPFKTFAKSMRVVGEIAHPQLKITIFNWNNRYLIKLEDGPFEQTFKVSELDIASEDELKKAVDAEFLQQAIDRFQDMAQSLHKSLERNN